MRLAGMQDTYRRKAHISPTDRSARAVSSGNPLRAVWQREKAGTMFITRCSSEEVLPFDSRKRIVRQLTQPATAAWRGCRVLGHTQISRTAVPVGTSPGQDSSTCVWAERFSRQAASATFENSANSTDCSQHVGKTAARTTSNVLWDCL